MNKILAISSCKNAEVVPNFYTVNMKNLRGHASYSFYLMRQQKGDGHFTKTNKIISDAVDSIAQITGNRYITENRIPPHITIGAFRETKKEKVENLD